MVTVTGRVRRARMARGSVKVIMKVNMVPLGDREG
jgi:hypothetical protein